jgi:hypothetical protein
MSISVAKYTFSSWLRKGIGAKINETDNLGGGASPVKERPTVPVDVQINAQNVHKAFALLGPGDVVGINPAMVVRTEPRHDNTNFEPNYLAFVEFYDEDFAWRYTPAKANDRRLRPWIVLLLLKEDEFTKDGRTLPLPNITVTKAQALPLAGDTWAWAHAHVNEGHASTSAFEAFLDTLHDLDDPNADKIVCRLMSPRRLEPDTAYHAFVVPAFETGRLAGLGQDPKDVDAQKPAWDAASANPTLPVYFEWYFRTGRNEDFESLVKLLEPRVVDERVGIRDMDGSKPGFGMTAAADLGVPTPPTAPPWIIGLEGALKAPSTTPRPATVDPTRPFFVELQSIVNFPAQWQKLSNTATDPVVSPPIYGENHALLHEVDVTKSGWLHTLNRDPRSRVSAGFGTKVIQENQDGYMARAWQQVQKILAANRKILFGAFSMHVTDALKSNFSGRLDAAKTVLLFSPILKKVKGSPTTLHQQLFDSRITTAAVSPAMRRLVRPRGPVFRRLAAADPAFSHTKLIGDLNDDRVSAAPPKVAPKGLRTDQGLASQLPGAGYSDWLKWLIAHRLALLVAMLLLALLLLFLGGLIAALALAAVAVGVYFRLSRLARQVDFASALTSPADALALIDSVPPRPDFAFTETDSAVPTAAAAGTSVTTTAETLTSAEGATTFTTQTLFTPGGAGGESVEAGNFRRAARRITERLMIEAPVQPRTVFDLPNAHVKLLQATDPRVAFPKQLASLVRFSFNPSWLLDPEHLVPAMAYPDFEDPMYEKLRDISSELLLPNLNLIPPNTLSLLETNPVFIESYMVGLNHEFGKELLWREFPTDTRPSSFRQFWDVKGIITNEGGLSAEALTEAWKDIVPIDTWPGASALGTHNRQHGKKNLVLVVRGELLKKYPRTIIYAQRAHLYKDPKTGVPQPTHEPVIVEVQTAAQMQQEIRFPVFKAEIDPDYKFFGFELTIDEARGAEAPKAEGDDWGWYFVIQQIPGEPRFGMDIAFAPDDDPTTPLTWDDMAWDKYPAGKAFIETATRPVAGFVPAGADSLAQWGTDSASMAYILYQKPVMIAIHAREMLDGLTH